MHNFNHQQAVESSHQPLTDIHTQDVPHTPCSHGHNGHVCATEVEAELPSPSNSQAQSHFGGFKQKGEDRVHHRDKLQAWGQSWRFCKEDSSWQGKAENEMETLQKL